MNTKEQTTPVTESTNDNAEKEGLTLRIRSVRARVRTQVKAGLRIGAGIDDTPGSCDGMSDW